MTRLVERRGHPHLPIENPDTPGCCATCNRPTALPNDMHQLRDNPAADEEARRLGEREDQG